MYSMVLVAALVGSGEATSHRYFVADPCPCCTWPIFPQGGRVLFFWEGPAGLTPEEEQEWEDYLRALDESDRSDAVYYWSNSDKEVKRRLLGQVRRMRAKKDEWEAKKLEAELKAKRDAEETARKAAEEKEAKEKEAKEKEAKEKEAKSDDEKKVEKKDDE